MSGRAMQRSGVGGSARAGQRPTDRKAGHAGRLWRQRSTWECDTSRKIGVQCRGPRWTDWRPQDPAAPLGRRGCAHPYSDGRALPAMVVLALCRCQCRGAMLMATDMPDSDATVRVLIVDDQASFRRAARSVVELTPG